MGACWLRKLALAPGMFCMFKGLRGKLLLPRVSKKGMESGSTPLSRMDFQGLSARGRGHIPAKDLDRVDKPGGDGLHSSYGSLGPAVKPIPVPPCFLLLLYCHLEQGRQQGDGGLLQCPSPGLLTSPPPTPCISSRFRPVRQGGPQGHGGSLQGPCGHLQQSEGHHRKLGPEADASVKGGGGEAVWGHGRCFSGESGRGFNTDNKRMMSGNIAHLPERRVQVGRWGGGAWGWCQCAGRWEVRLRVSQGGTAAEQHRLHCRLSPLRGAPPPACNLPVTGPHSNRCAPALAHDHC